MKIKIELEYAESCGGCPLIHLDDVETPYCGMDYDIIWGSNLIRPLECIEDNGE